MKNKKPISALLFIKSFILQTVPVGAIVLARDKQQEQTVMTLTETLCPTVCNATDVTATPFNRL